MKLDVIELINAALFKSLYDLNKQYECLVSIPHIGNIQGWKISACKSISCVSSFPISLRYGIPFSKTNSSTTRSKLSFPLEYLVDDAW